MGRPDQMTAEQQRELGHAVLSARAGRTPWKVLERLYGRSRMQLQRYARAVRPQHPFSKMIHLRHCETA
jgi:hypothetical protein